MAKWRCLPLLLLAALCSAAARAADPGGEFRIDEPPGVQGLPVLDATSDGAFVVAWDGWDGEASGIIARRFGADAAPLGGQFQVNLAGAYYQRVVSLSADPVGFTVVWNNQGHYYGGSVVARRFDRQGSPTTGEFTPRTGQRLASAAIDVDTDPAGRSRFVWRDCCDARGRPRILARRYDSRGRPLGPALRVNQRPAGSGGAPSVALDASGAFVVVWETTSIDADELPETLLFGRRFDPQGAPRGDEFRINALSAGRYFEPEVASDAEGNFVVAWGPQTYPATPGLEPRVLARLYDRRGVPRTAEFQVHTRPLGSPFHASPVAVAMGGDGEFLVAWTATERRTHDFFPVARTQRFDAAGRREGGEFSLDPRSDPRSSFPALAADAAGRIVAVWLAEGVFGRRLAPASRGADPCAWGRNRLLCDTAHDGGEEETAIPVRLRPGDLAVLGDLDGDGRDDPCVFRGGRFLCDTGHDGGAFEMEVTLEAPGEGPRVPLLGDPDGEGRDDACLFRDGVLFCDAAHNGGTAEVIVEPAAVVGDVALLGDLDGNGADELCLFRVGEFEGSRFADLLCDTAHDGGGHELHLRFAPAEAGDVPLLGDADGDGDDDPCLVRAGRFLCDTAHDGGEPELELIFALPGTVPVLGNVDGV